MSRRTLALILIGSIVLHVGMAAAVGAIKKKETREVVAISLAESKKKEAEKKKPPPPPPPPEKETKTTRPKLAKAAPPPKAEPAPEAAAKATPGMAEIPDFGLPTMGNGTGGFALPAPGHSDPTATTKKTLTAPPPKVLGPAPAPEGECTEAAVKPKPISVPQPAYTESARAAALEGRVRVQLTVDATGKVTSAVVLQGLGSGLDEAALAAARAARFQPGTRCGKPVSATFVIGMRFSL